MKKTTRRVLSLILALGMALTLTACKKKPQNSAQSTGGASAADSSAPQPAAPAVPEPVMPSLDNLLSADEVEQIIDRYEKDGSNDYTHWYPDGDKFAEFYLIFEDDNYLTVRDANGEEYYSTRLEGNHIVNSSPDGPELDFVFVDNLTCYDLVNDQWYLSADYNEAFASLTAATFYNTEGGETWDFTFYEDGTYYWNYGTDEDDFDEGVWWFDYAHQIAFTSAYGEASVDVYYAEDSWQIIAIGYGRDLYYPEP